jgi:hypothetical protein
MCRVLYAFGADTKAQSLDGLRPEELADKLDLRDVLPYFCSPHGLPPSRPDFVTWPDDACLVFCIAFRTNGNAHAIEFEKRVATGDMVPQGLIALSHRSVAALAEKLNEELRKVDCP